MILSFYDKGFNGLQDNASLIIDNDSYSLIRRAVDCDELKCTCEAFTENIQPTFVIIKSDTGRYIYGALAGIPQLTEENQTKITASDIKTMLKSDVVLDLTKQFVSVNEFFNYVFEEWKIQVNQKSFNCELQYSADIGLIKFEYLNPSQSAEHQEAYDVWEDVFAPYLKYYGLYMTTMLDLIHKKVIFFIGKSMLKDLNVKLWEYGIYDYGKWVANVNETQGYVLNTQTNGLTKGYKWILTTKNEIFAINPDEIEKTNEIEVKERDIFPIKRRVVIKEIDDINKSTEALNAVNAEALRKLADSKFQENIEVEGIDADFETKFNVYNERGKSIYKSLPCGELHYNAAGLKKVQIGYRITGIAFLL